jgi:hypothetical protein
VDAAWIEPAAALAHLPQVSVEGEPADRLAHGMTIPWPTEVAAGEAVAVLRNGRLLAVGDLRDGWLHPRKVFG